jgi:catechol 2,3-dioxygenase-like lactoylglutathione lyase family enzyme
MLSDHPAYATLPTADVQTLPRFYEDVLGFVPREENPAGVFYDAGGGTYFIVTRSGGKASGTHTQTGFRVSDIEAEVRDLQHAPSRSRNTRTRRRSMASPPSRSGARPGFATPTATSSG